MYICEEHGQLESEWCDICEKIFECDCLDRRFVQVKDVVLDYKDIEKTITINIFICNSCGEVTAYVKKVR